MEVQWKEVQPDGSMSGSAISREIPETEVEEFSYENENEIVRVYVELEDTQEGLSVEARILELQTTVPFEVHRIFEKENAATLNLEVGQVKRLEKAYGIKSVTLMGEAELTHEELQAEGADSTEAEAVSEEDATEQESESVSVSEQNELNSQEETLGSTGESIEEKSMHENYQSVSDQQIDGGTPQNQTGITIKIGGALLLGCIVLVGIICAIQFRNNR